MKKWAEMIFWLLAGALIGALIGAVLVGVLGFWYYGLWVPQRMLMGARFGTLIGAALIGKVIVKEVGVRALYGALYGLLTGVSYGLLGGGSLRVASVVTLGKVRDWQSASILYGALFGVVVAVLVAQILARIGRHEKHRSGDQMKSTIVRPIGMGVVGAVAGAIVGMIPFAVTMVVVVAGGDIQGDPNTGISAWLIVIWLLGIMALAGVLVGAIVGLALIGKRISNNVGAGMLYGSLYGALVVYGARMFSGIFFEGFSQAMMILGLVLAGAVAGAFVTRTQHTS